jgi:hypothetical protein
MRILLVALAIVWLAVTGAAFESGRRVEAEYRAALEALARDGTPVSLARYQRGIFRSEAVTVIGPTGLAEGETSATRLVVHQRIDHGPYPWSWIGSGKFDGHPIAARVEAEPVVEVEGVEVIEEVPLPLVIRALFTRSDGGSVWIVPDPDAEPLDDPELSGDWRSVRAEAGFAYDGSAVSGDLEVPRVAFERDEASFRLEGLALELDLERAPTPTPVYVGSSHLHLALLSVEGPEGGIVLRDLDLENASDVGQGTWSLQVDGSLGAVEERDGRESVPRRVGAAELVAHIGGIGLEPLAEIESLAREIEAVGPTSDAAKAELTGAAVALWPRLMAPGPEIEISRLRVETPEGELRMAFRVGVDPSDPILLVHPLASLSALELDFELSLPRPLLEGWLALPRPVTEPGGDAAPWVVPAELASQRIQTWLERGHLSQYDGRYVTSVRVREGVVRLNGRIVSLGDL